jgi:hypothetical protein
MLIQRTVSDARRGELTWEQLWKGPDAGIIASWERGLEKRTEDAAMAQRALSGELLVLPWKGGVERPIKARKYGTFLYLAMWQGLRGEPLNIETSQEVTLVCARTQMQVTYTSNRAKYAIVSDEDEV